MLITSGHQQGHSLPKPFLYTGNPLSPFVFHSFIFALALMAFLSSSHLLRYSFSLILTVVPFVVKTIGLLLGRTIVFFLSLLP